MVPDGDARGTGENFERITFDLARTTKFRFSAAARGFVSGDQAIANEVYLDAGFDFSDEDDVSIQLVFSDQIQGEGALEREIICPPGQYTFAAAATVLSCELMLQEPQQVTADAEVSVRVEVVHCPGD